MLEFNPFYRPTVEECLKDPYFSRVTQFSKVEHAEHEVDLKVEHKCNSFAELRQLIAAEVAYFQSKNGF